MELMTRSALNQQAHQLSERAQLFSQGLDVLSHSQANLAIDEAAVKALEHDCDELKRNIQSVKSDCEQLPPGPSTLEEVSPLLQCRKLNAMLDVWQQQAMPVVSAESALVKATAVHRLQKSVEDIQHVFAVVRGQRLLAAEQLEREKKLYQETQQLEHSLKQKVCDAEETSKSVESNRRVGQRLEEAEISCTDLREKLKRFEQKYISQPSQAGDGLETRQSQRRKQTTLDALVSSKDGGSSESSESCLSNVIEQLITRSLSSHDPYISMEAIWEPHFNLLLRSGILLRHPDNPSMIRITPFYR